MTDTNPSKPDADLASSMRMAGLVWQSITEVAAGAIIGWLLDLAFDTDKIFLLICGLLGILVGMTSFIRTAMQESRRQSRLARKRRSQPESKETSP
ncbi:MAG: AtpZ/AtpI family protein [Phycisphaerales bacterium]|nr:AtpZ/AtpI family protein [Phycisphaerales bacterium]